MAAATVARWTHVDVHSTLLIAASTGAPYLLMPAWPVALVGLALHQRWLALVAIVLVVVDLVVTAPLVGGGRGLTAEQRSATSTSIRVLALNVEYDHFTGPSVTQQVRAQDPDIVVLSELSGTSTQGLDLSQYPYSFVDPRFHNGGGGVWSRWPLSDASTWNVAGKHMVRATVTLPDGQTVRLWQVHTQSPTASADLPVWRAQLRELADALHAQAGPAIMAGDFNSSRTDRDFAQILGHGVVDAADGRGLLPTWPSSKRVIWPVLRLDHVLVSRELGVRAVKVLGPTGSDHRAVVADLVLAR